MSTIENTFNYALELELDEVSFNVPYPLPGSRLFDRVSGVNGTNDWTMENEIKFLYKTELNEEIIKEKIENFFARWSSLNKLNEMVLKT